MIDEYDRSLIDSVGNNTTIYPSVEILVEKKQGDGRGIFIGSDCIIYPRNRLVLGDMTANPDADISVGNHVMINAGGYLSGEGGLTIDDYVLIGPNACILSAGHKYLDARQTIQAQRLTYGPIVIERDAWIGASSVVLQGVTIGQGAVIGAGSVISKDVPPNAVVVGMSGRIIKYRGAPNKRGPWGLLSRLFRRGDKVNS